MNAVHVFLQRLQPRGGWAALGWPGALGLACLLAALCWAVGWAPQREAALQALLAQAQAERAAALQRAATAQQHDDAAPVLPPDQAFLVAFPPLVEREARVLGLWQQAREHGIEPLRSEFRMSEEPGLGLVRYRIVWPVSGSYAQLRGLVDAALAADPALSLDALELARNDEQPGQLKAQVVWSLWMRGAAASNAAPRTAGAAP